MDPSYENVPLAKIHGGGEKKNIRALNSVPDPRNRIYTKSEKTVDARRENKDKSSLFAGQKGERVNHNSNFDGIVIFSQSFDNSNLRKSQWYGSCWMEEKVETLVGDGAGEQGTQI